MSEYEYKVDDRVRVVADAVYPSNNGKLGVVTGVRDSSPWPLLVELERGEEEAFRPEELELLAEPATGVIAHPSHYTKGTPDGVEAIDIIRAHMAAGGTWETANALKYILRHTLKGNPKQDLAKAAQYLAMWAERADA